MITLGKFLNIHDAYDQPTLTDWYITSVMDDKPVWAQAHLDELLNDFYIIPKDAQVKHLHTAYIKKQGENYGTCSFCNMVVGLRDKFCKHCGSEFI